MEINLPKNAIINYFYPFSSLTIHNTDLENGGYYICNGTNYNQEKFYALSSLSVQGKSDMEFQ